MTEQDIWDALATLLGATDLGDHVYDYGTVPGENGVPGTLPDYFVLLTVERRFVEHNRGGGTSRTGWRATVRYVDRFAGNARLVGGWVREAFEVTPGRGKRIEIGGVESTAITHESTTAVEPDDGMFSGLSSWTFAL